MGSSSGGAPGGSGSGGSLFGSYDAGASGSGSGGSTGTPGMLVGTLRDFQFWDGTTSTNPDFENPPYGTQNPTTFAGGGPWDDPDIVTDTLGSDGKPVYKNPNGTPDANGRVTSTTHGKAAFDQWFRDTPGINIPVQYPLPLTKSSASGSTVYGYDSNTAGYAYGCCGQTGGGFFPLDDGTMYGKPTQMTFGNQALVSNPNPNPAGDPSADMHNYSFTFELHTTFTYEGGETFDFRGDDDIFVYINSKLVVNLGGIHGPEVAPTVMVDSLGLTRGDTYPLDFFSVERHVVLSNIRFTTTLVLRTVQ
jgi:fibro-slime domain-containing protein